MARRARMQLVCYTRTWLLCASLLCFVQAAVGAADTCDTAAADGGTVLIRTSCVWAGVTWPSAGQLTINGAGGLSLNDDSSAILQVVTAGSQEPPTAAAELHLEVQRLVLKGFTVAPPGAQAARLWPLELGSSSPGPGSTLRLSDVRILMPAEQVQAWIQFFNQQPGLVLQTDGNSWLYVGGFNSSAMQLKSVSLHAPGCLQPSALLPPAAPSEAKQQQQQQAPPCLLQVNNDTLVPTLLAYAGQPTSTPLLVYINSNVSLGSMAEVASGWIPINRPLVLVGLASHNTSMDFKMQVEQLNLTGSAFGTVTFQNLVLENLATGGEASSRASGPFSVLIQNNVFPVYYDRGGPVRLFVRECIIVVQPTELDYLVYMAALFASPLPYLTQQTDFLRKDIGTTEWVAHPGPDDSLLIVKITGTRAREWTNTTVVSKPVVAPPLHLPPNTAGTLQPNKPSPVLHAVRSPAEILVSLQQRDQSPADRAYVLLVWATIKLPPSGVWAPEGTPLIAAPLEFMGQLDDAAWLDFGYREDQLRLPGAATATWLSFSQLSLRGLPQGSKANGSGSAGASSAAVSGASSQRQHRKLLESGAASPVLPPEQYTVLLWSVDRSMSVQPLMHLAGVSLLLPAPELALFQAQAAASSAFVLQLQGSSLGISVQGASILNSSSVHLLSLSGPGLSGDNITLGLDPQGTQQPGYVWDADTPAAWTAMPPAGTSQTQLSSWKLALAILLPLLGLLAAVGAAVYWWRRSQRPQPPSAPPPLCQVCKSAPCRCGTAANAVSDSSSSLGKDTRGLPADTAIRDQGHASLPPTAAAAAAAKSGAGPSAADRKAAYIASSLMSWQQAISSTTLSIVQRRLDLGSGGGSGSVSRLHTRTSSCNLQMAAARADHGSVDGASSAAGSAASRSSEQQQQQQQQQQQHVKLIELIGVGGFGSVYKGTWRSKEVAVKVMQLPANALLMDPTTSNSCYRPAAVAVAAVGLRAATAAGHLQRCKGRTSHQMAIMEAVVSSIMNHPNVVQVYTYTLNPMSVTTLGSRVSSGQQQDAAAAAAAAPAAAGDGRSDGQAVEASCRSEPDVTGWELKVVMEYCNQGCLREALNRRLLCPEGSHWPSPSAVLSIAHDVGSALLHLHSEGIVHGDIKAANILLSCPGEPGRQRRSGSYLLDMHVVAKVADFGLALLLGPADTHATQHSRGTPTHMSPELFMNGHVSKASDVYAFGILLWELVTGERAFAGVPLPLLPHEVARNHMRPGWPPALQQVSPAYAGLRQLVEQCWAQRPSDRPPFQEVLPRLEEFVAAAAAAAAAGRQQRAASTAVAPTTVALAVGAGTVPAGKGSPERQQQQEQQQPRLMGALGGPPAAPGRHPALMQAPRYLVIEQQLEEQPQNDGQRQYLQQWAKQQLQQAQPAAVVMPAQQPAASTAAAAAAAGLAAGANGRSLQPGAAGAVSSDTSWADAG